MNDRFTDNIVRLKVGELYVSRVDRKEIAFTPRKSDAMKFDVDGYTTTESLMVNGIMPVVEAIEKHGFSVKIENHKIITEHIVTNHTINEFRIKF